MSTPSGVAAVSGSMLGVFYDPETKTMTATCLEGHCSLRNDSSILELVAGQAADILNGILSNEPRSLNETELRNWIEFTPELNNYPDILSSLPGIQNILNNLPNRPPFTPPFKTPHFP